MSGHVEQPKARSSRTAESTLVMATLGLITGLVIGLAGPLAMVVVSPAFAGGPTWGGLALLLGAGLALVLGPAALLPWGRWWTLPLFAGCVCLAAGILAGAEVGNAYGTGSWARATPAIHNASPLVLVRVGGARRVEGGHAAEPCAALRPLRLPA